MSELILSVPKLRLISSFCIFTPFIHLFPSLTHPRAVAMLTLAMFCAPLHALHSILLGQSLTWGYFALCDIGDQKDHSSSQDLHWECSTGNRNTFILLVNKHLEQTNPEPCNAASVGWHSTFHSKYSFLCCFLKGTLWSTIMSKLMYCQGKWENHLSSLHSSKPEKLSPCVFQHKIWLITLEITHSLA